MITISIVGFTPGRPPGPIFRDIKASAIIEITNGVKTKRVNLWLHDVPDRSAEHSDDEAEIMRVANHAINDPAFRRKIEGWL